MEKKKEKKKETKTINEISEELKELEKEASDEEGLKRSARQMTISQSVSLLIGCIMLVVAIVEALLWRVRISGSTKEFIGVVVAIAVAISGGYRTATIVRDEDVMEESRSRPRREAREAKMRILMKEIGKAKEEEEKKEREKFEKASKELGEILAEIEREGKERAKNG